MIKKPLEVPLYSVVLIGQLPQGKLRFACVVLNTQLFYETLKMTNKKMCLDFSMVISFLYLFNL